MEFTRTSIGAYDAIAQGVIVTYMRCHATLSHFNFNFQLQIYKLHGFAGILDVT